MLEGQVLERSRLGDGFSQSQGGSATPFYAPGFYDLGHTRPSILPAERQVGFWKVDSEPNGVHEQGSTAASLVEMISNGEGATEGLERGGYSHPSQHRPMRGDWVSAVSRESRSRDMWMHGSTAHEKGISEKAGSPRVLEEQTGEASQQWGTAALNGNGSENAQYHGRLSGGEREDGGFGGRSYGSAVRGEGGPSVEHGRDSWREGGALAPESADEKHWEDVHARQLLRRDGERTLRGLDSFGGQSPTGRVGESDKRNGIDIPGRKDVGSHDMAADRSRGNAGMKGSFGSDGAAHGSTSRGNLSLLGLSLGAKRSGHSEEQEGIARVLQAEQQENLEDWSQAHGVADADASMFSSSFPEIFQSKLSFSERDTFRGHSMESRADILGELQDDHCPYGSLEELESQTIGKLLPDDEDELLAGVFLADMDYRGRSAAEDMEEFDLFSSSGGLELGDGDGLDNGSSSRTVEQLAGIPPMTASGSSAANVAGEHPFGEHPSRTLFVRNINSNVEDSELRELFEKYGAIRTLYTACKHRGFVMISYYDIRAAKNAMRALQNKPLRRRKLDIHFSIPKENPSDKDVNQGTLVVFNLDASVGNDELRHIFGQYGEIKEIRETPHKRHHKFIEFYDVRAAEQALRALNRSDIAGKRIKLEPSRPGGTRRSLMQQLSAELAEEENRPQRPSTLSPYGPSSPPSSSGAWAVGSPNGSSDFSVRNGVSSSQALPSSPATYAPSLYNKIGPIGSLGSPSMAPSTGTLAAGSLGSCLPPHPSSPPVRLGLSSDARELMSQLSLSGGNSNALSSLATLTAALHRLPPQHPHSLPEYGSGILSPHAQYSGGSGLSGSTLATSSSLRQREGVEVPSRLHRTSSGNHLGSAHLIDYESSGGSHGTNSLHYGSGPSSSLSSQAYLYGGSGSSLPHSSLGSGLSAPWPPLAGHHTDRGGSLHSFSDSPLGLQRSLSLNSHPLASHSAHLSHSQSHSSLGQLANGHGHGMSYGSLPFSLSHSQSHPSLQQGGGQGQSPRIPQPGSSNIHGLAMTGSLHNLHLDLPHDPSSAPLLDRRHSYLGDSPDLVGGRAGSLGAMLGHDATVSGPSSPSMGMMSPPTKNGFMERRTSFVGASSLGAVGLGDERSGMSMMERGVRAKRAETPIVNDNKRQFQLDVDKIRRRDDMRTTLMIKNIPNKYTQKMLLAAIDENHRGTYDFFYLPIDFKNKCNVGYAFINMIDPLKIIAFFEAFNGKKWEKFNSEKVASLAYARIQGKNALVAHFQNSSLMNEDKRCRPILFHSEGPHVGDQEPFPVGATARLRPSRGSNGSASHVGSPSNSTTSSKEESSHGNNFFGPSSGSVRLRDGFLGAMSPPDTRDREKGYYD